MVDNHFLAHWDTINKFLALMSSMKVCPGPEELYKIKPRVYKKGERKYLTLYCPVQALFEEYIGQTDHKYRR